MKDYVYRSIKEYLKFKGDDYVPTGAIEFAHLAARAATSGDSKAAADYGKAAIDSMSKFAKAKGYTVGLTSLDVFGMVAVSPKNSPDEQGVFNVTPEDRFLERLVRFGRAVKIKPQVKQSAKAAAKPAAKPAADTLAALAAQVAALSKALEAFKA